MNVKGKDKPVCIRLKVDWMGNQEGAKLHVWESVAKKLLERNACEILDDKVRKEMANGELKEVSSPQIDKMVKKPSKSK